MRRSKGFTLIELLIVVAIIGIIAAIAIPNMLDAIERARQKKSVGEIRATVIALQRFGVDYSGYPNSSHNGPLDQNLPMLLDQDGDIIIVPAYIQAIPQIDGWGQSYSYFASPDGTVGNPKIMGNEVLATHYCVYSSGSDRVEQPEPDGAAPATDVATNWCQLNPVPVGTRDTHCFESDIVWGDAQFQQSPDGKQKKCG